MNSDKMEILRLNERILELEKELELLKSTNIASSNRKENHDETGTGDNEGDLVTEDEDGTQGNDDDNDGYDDNAVKLATVQKELHDFKKNPNNTPYVEINLRQARKLTFKAKFKHITLPEIFERWFGFGKYVNIPMTGGLDAVDNLHKSKWHDQDMQIYRAKRIAHSIKDHLDMYRDKLLECLNDFATDDGDNGKNFKLTHIHSKLEKAGLLDWKDKDAIVDDLINRLMSKARGSGDSDDDGDDNDDGDEE